MAIIPDRVHSTVSFIDFMHEEKRDLEKPRPYFQISSIGHPCERWLWLQFRWAVFEQFPGRVLRLFRRGQLEEDVAVQDLRDIGVVIDYTGSNQLTLSAGKFVSGHPDGIIKRGLPEAQNTEHLWECKTHSLKSFSDLLSKQSVLLSKPMHWAQMQVYMYLKSLRRGLYHAICKDNDHLYLERIEADPKAARAYIEKGQRLALTERMPEPLSTRPDWYQCRFCAAHDFCHVSHKIKEVNCRTCAHATPLDNETWTCSRWDVTIPDFAQIEGCDSHVIHPDLVPWKLDQEKSTEKSAAYIIGDQVVINGDGGYPSSELLNSDGPFNDPVIDLVRGVFNGEVNHNA